MKKLFTTVLLTVLASSLLNIPVFSAGWVSDANGYRYQNDDGSFKQSEWIKDSDNRWYYIGESGYMMHDQWIAGEYYVGSDGAMLTDTTTPDFYKVGKDGKDVLTIKVGQNESAKLLDGGLE